MEAKHDKLDYLRLMVEMEPFIDRLNETKDQDPEASKAANDQWKAAWVELERIKEEHPFAISAAYVTPSNRYLKKYNPEFRSPEKQGDGLE